MIRAPRGQCPLHCNYQSDKLLIMCGIDFSIRLNSRRCAFYTRHCCEYKSSRPWTIPQGLHSLVPRCLKYYFLTRALYPESVSTLPYITSVSSCSSKRRIGIQQRSPSAANGIMTSQTVLMEFAKTCLSVSRSCLGRVWMIEMSENDILGEI